MGLEGCDEGLRGRVWEMFGGKLEVDVVVVGGDEGSAVVKRRFQAV